MRLAGHEAAARLPPRPAFVQVRAVEVGFEPTEGLPLHTLSRRAPSATRRLHRRRAYRRRAVPGSLRSALPAALEELGEDRCALVGEDSAQHLHWRAESRIVQYVPDRPGGPGPRVLGSEYQPAHPGYEQRARAHGARLERR